LKPGSTLARPGFIPNPATQGIGIGKHIRILPPDQRIPSFPRACQVLGPLLNIEFISESRFNRFADFLEKKSGFLSGKEAFSLALRIETAPQLQIIPRPWSKNPILNDPRNGRFIKISLLYIFRNEIAMDFLRENRGQALRQS
jgi:hypothetical protein